MKSIKLITFIDKTAFAVSCLLCEVIAASAGTKKYYLQCSTTCLLLELICCTQLERSIRSHQLQVFSSEVNDDENLFPKFHGSEVCFGICSIEMKLTGTKEEYISDKIVCLVS